jgi:selenocysteine lyase/cysteine desulfurase
VIARLRAALGRLLGVPAEEIILGNSASYGMHLLANGLPWTEGDEVLLVHGDFPSVLNFKPWAASIEYLLGIGIEQIAAYDQHLVECFLAGLDPTRYDLRVPQDPARRSTLVFFSHRDPNPELSPPGATTMVGGAVIAVEEVALSN